MYFEQINIEETHIRLTTDLNNQHLKKYIYNIRFDLKTYIRKNKLFQLSLEPIKVNEDNLPTIIQKMYSSSDIALINDSTVLCGIYSNNKILGNEIAFKLKARKKPLGICTSSGKIGHSISFGESDSVTVISKSPSVADGLATRIANEVNGENSEEKVSNALETAENYREYFEGILLISENNIGSIDKI